MPATRRSRTLPTTPQELWRTVGDPHHLPRWWPRVERVEQVSAGAFTQVMRTPRAKTVRADFRLSEIREPEEIAWTQDVEDTPFERVLAESTTTVRLSPALDGATTVELEQRQRLRGFARFGGVMVRKATRKTLDEALDALESATAGPAGTGFATPLAE